MISESFVFERRKYEGDSLTEEVKQALSERVQLHSDYIIKYEEVPVCSVDTINLMFEHTNQLLKSMGKSGLILDLTATDVPDAQVRRTINLQFKDVCNPVEHVAFVTGKKPFFNTLVKFTMFQTNLDSYSLHETFEQAVEKTNDVLGVR